MTKQKNKPNIDGVEGDIPEDPRVRLLTYWVELFRQEMDPFPKKKSDQIEWSAMYGNFFWVSGWALMQLKEEGSDCAWTNWTQLSGDELLSLASDFANFIYAEDIKPILNPEEGVDPSLIGSAMSDFEDPENLESVVERIKENALSFDSLGYWYFSESNNAYVFYIEDKKLANQFLKKSEGFFEKTMIPTIEKNIEKGHDQSYLWLKIFTAISNKGYDIALDAG